MRLAAEQGMAGLSFRIAEIMRKETGKSWYGALYPHPPFKTDFTVDEALVWAVSRQNLDLILEPKAGRRQQG